MIRRLAGAAAVAAVALPLLTATPAAAGTAELSGPSGTSKDDTVTVRGSVSLAGRIDQLTITITGDGVPGTTITTSCADPIEGVTCANMNRQATVAVPVRLDHNGRYAARLTALHRQSGLLDPPDDSASAGPASFAVEAPPAAPRSLAATPDAAAGHVTLTWRSNTEPDLVGYLVFRATGGGTPEQVAMVDPSSSRTVSWVDDSAAGEVSYYVQAGRRNAAGDGVVVGKPSSTVHASLPRPTTTVAAGPGAAGAGGSGQPAGTLTPSEAIKPHSAGAALQPGSQLDLSSFRALRGPDLPPPPAPGDPGYQETLPYRPGAAPTTAVPAPRNEAALGDDAAVVTEEPGGRKALLSFVAAALVLFLLSMHTRWLLRRAAPAPTL